MNQQTIFTVYVLMQSQSDCDDAKRICEAYGLPMWKHHIAFKFLKTFHNYFCSEDDKDFAIYNMKREKNEISLTRFKELCEEYKLNK